MTNQIQSPSPALFLLQCQHKQESKLTISDVAESQIGLPKYTELAFKLISVNPGGGSMFLVINLLTVRDPGTVTVVDVRDIVAVADALVNKLNEFVELSYCIRPL